MGLLSFLPAVQALTQQLADAKAQVRTLRDEVKALQEEAKRLDKHARTPVLDPHALKAVLKGDGRHYQSAEPFPHIVIDNFLPPATMQADVLLGRIAAVTELLKQRNAGWDAMDETAARLLLSDLALLTGWWRGLGSVTSTRLEIASRELPDALRSAQRALKTSDSGS